MTAKRIGLAAIVVAVTAVLVLAAAGAADVPTFGRDGARTGWDQQEPSLTPAQVASPAFGPLWSSPRLDSANLAGTSQRPHIYASPLYVDNLAVTSGSYAGKQFGAVIAATGAGWVYAIKAFDVGAPAGVPNGTILWRTFLGQPSAGPDGGVALGVLGTPVIDRGTNRLYVASDVTDAGGRNWKVFALDLGSGAVQAGWPLTINDSTLAPINQNGPAKFQGAAAMSQRGALNLSPDGRLLYVPFGAYGDGGAGYLVAVNTAAPSLASAFSGAPSTVATANGGMWGAGGPAVDASGSVYDTTGNSPNGSGPAPNTWGNSLLRFRPGTPLALTGTYTPWNYCQMDQYDTDLGGSSPVVVPALDPATTSTPSLIAFGGKQGNAYIVNAAAMPGSLSQRPPCSTDASTDRSLLPPGNQPQFGKPGPLNIFGPYSEDQYNQTDFAKARTTPAYFRAADGTSYLVYSGSTKVAVGQREVQPPSVIKVTVVTAPGQPAYLQVAGQDGVLRFMSPGSPVVTTSGSAGPIAWVIDANVFRTASLTAAGVAHPVLYAVDLTTMAVLFQTRQDETAVAGKYFEPAIARGDVFVATDRVTAFGLRSWPPGHCAGGSATGSGAASQTGAQAQLWIPGFRSVAADNPPGCAPFAPAISYTATSDRAGKDAWGASGGALTTSDQFVATDEPPADAEVANMIAAGGGPGQRVHTIPVGQEPVAMIVHPPTGCSLTAQPKLLNNDLSSAWAGTDSSFAQLFPSAGGNCGAAVTRVAASAPIAATGQLKAYLAKVDGSTWGGLQGDGGAWPASAASPLFESPTQTDTAAHIAQYVKQTPGTIGYVPLTDALAQGFSRSPGAGLFWVQLQNNGTSATAPTFADPDSTDGRDQANCFATSYAGIPAGADPTLASWSAVSGAAPAQSAPANYSICALTYALAWDSYALAYGDTAAERGAFRTTSDLLRFETDPNYAGGGAFVIKGRGYAHVPGSALLTIANKGAYAVAY